MVARHKEDVFDAIQRHVLPYGTLLQGYAIEQRALRPASLPLIERVIAFRITIFHDHPGMVSIDPIDKAAPGVLPQLQKFPSFQVCLKRNIHLLGARLRIKIRYIAFWVTLKTADTIAIKRCSKGRFRDTPI